jgi:hypothetical protein
MVNSITFVTTTNRVEATPSKSTEKRLANVILESAIENRPATIIQSSASTPDVDFVVTGAWGLVSTIVAAYNRHHRLILRPDDVWQAILTQFSFYVNANGEALRDCFVDFQGKKTLVIKMEGILLRLRIAWWMNKLQKTSKIRRLSSGSYQALLRPRLLIGLQLLSASCQP